MTGRVSCLVVAVALVGHLTAAPAALASRRASIEGVHFPGHYEVEDTRLTLNCVGLLRYMRLIKAYVAALYVEDGAPSDAVLTDVAKRIEIEYFHAISAADFVRAGDQILAQNVDAGRLEALRPRLERMNSLYADVQPGDRYALTYTPGRGTELALNGQPLGVIEGADFAAAMFSIWLGPQPIDTSLRSQLLQCS